MGSTGPDFPCTKPVDFSKPIDPSKFKDRSVIVTGGANGIGLGAVDAFARAGAYVTIFDINEERGNSIVSAANDKGQHVQFIKTDTTSWSAQVAGFKAAIAFAPSKTVDLVIASAGVTSDNIGSWLEKAVSAGEDPEVPSSVAIDINLRAVYHTTHLALYYFKKTLPESGTGSVDKHLIFISSIAGYVALNNSADYNASKFGVRGLWKAIRQSNSILGDNATFRTNLIAPTFIDTPLTQSIQPVLRKSGFDIATVEDVVAGIMRAACDEEVSGRAIAIAAGKSTAGDSNFDLRDDFDGLDAGQVMKDKISDGTYGGMQHLGKAYFRK